MVGRHAAGTRRAALTALGALVLTGLPAAAEAAPPPAPGPARTTAAAHTLGADRPSAQVLHALGRDLGLTRPRRPPGLVNEAEAGTRAGRLHNALGRRFAGAWVSGATSAELTVATTDAADVAAIRAGARRPRSSRRRSRPADRQGEAGRGRAPRPAATRRSGTSTSQQPGRRAGRRAGRRPRRSSGRERATGASAVRVEASNERRGPCTTSAAVTRTTSTAPPAAPSGSPSPRAAAGLRHRRPLRHAPATPPPGYNQVAQGTFQGSSFPGNDYSWVAVNNNWTAHAHQGRRAARA